LALIGPTRFYRRRLADRTAGERSLELRQPSQLELADALTGQPELLADLARGLGRSDEPEPARDHDPLLRREPSQRASHLGPVEIGDECLERVACRRADTVAELVLAVVADRRVQRRAHVRRVQRLVDVVRGDPGRGGELLARRLASELELEPPRGAAEGDPAVDDVEGQTDEAAVIADRPPDGLTDPPARVGREPVAATPVESLGGAEQPERAFLDQVGKRDAEASVRPRDRDHQPQVRLDQPAARSLVAPLDRLRQRDLLGRRQEAATADLRQEQLEAVVHLVGIQDPPPAAPLHPQRR
jgi:hypothetical protein